MKCATNRSAIDAETLRCYEHTAAEQFVLGVAAPEQRHDHRQADSAEVCDVGDVGEQVALWIIMRR